MAIIDLLDRIHTLHAAGQSPADADLLSALGELAPHAENLRNLLELGEQLAHGMNAVVLHYPEPMGTSDLVTRGSNARLFLQLLED
jgi:hypothetical protein